MGSRSCSLEQFGAHTLIEAAFRAYGEQVAISTALGPSGLCVLNMAQQVFPEVSPYFIDTGFNFKETQEVADKWIKRGVNLKRVLPILTPSEQAAVHGDKLWEREPDKCCHFRKVEPNEFALQGKKIWISALRRDQSPSRAETPVLEWVTLGNGHSLWKLCPLVRWTKKDVWRYIMGHHLPYNALHDQGYPSVGCTHCTAPVAEGNEDERAGRWSGNAKTECGLHVKTDLSGSK